MNEVNLMTLKHNKNIINLVATQHFVENLNKRKINLALLSEVSKRINNLKIGEKTGFLVDKTIFFVCRENHSVVKLITAYTMRENQIQKKFY